MSCTVRCTSPVRGSKKVSELPTALATMTDFSSGVMYRWCGSLPVGTLLVSTQRWVSMTLTLALKELRTKIGAGTLAAVTAFAGGTSDFAIEEGLLTADHATQHQPNAASRHQRILFCIPAQFSFHPAPCRADNGSGRSHRDQFRSVQPAPRTGR